MLTPRGLSSACFADPGSSVTSSQLVNRLFPRSEEACLDNGAIVVAAFPLEDQRSAIQSMCIRPWLKRTLQKRRLQ